MIAKYQSIKTGLMQDLLTCGIDEKGNIRSKRTHKFVKKNGIEVPVEWDVDYLPKFCYYQNGKAFPSKEYIGEGVRLVKPGNLDISGYVDLNNRHQTFIDKKFWETESRYRVYENELLMNLTAQSLEDGFLGRVCLTQPNTNCLLNQRIARITPKEGINTHYLWWLFQSDYFRSYINSKPNGSKILHLYNNDLNNSLLLVPKNISEQRKIASILNEQLEIQNNLKSNLAKLQSIKTGLMQDLLSGKK